MDIFAFAQNNEVEFVSLRFIDTRGYLSSIDLTLRYFVSNYENIIIDEVQFTPSLERFCLDPFRSVPTLIVMANSDSHKDLRLLASQFQNDGEMHFTTTINFTMSFDENSFDEESECSTLQLANMRVEIMRIMKDMLIVPYYCGSFQEQSRIVFSSNSLVKACDDLMLTLYVIEQVIKSYGMEPTFSQEYPIAIDIAFDRHVPNYLDSNISFFSEYAFDLERLTVKHDKIKLLLDMESNVYLYLTMIVATYLNDNDSQEPFLAQLKNMML
jgi:hypothetical protein